MVQSSHMVFAGLPDTKQLIAVKRTFVQVHHNGQLHLSSHCQVYQENLENERFEHIEGPAHSRDQSDTVPSKFWGHHKIQIKFSVLCTSGKQCCFKSYGISSSQLQFHFTIAQQQTSYRNKCILYSWWRAYKPFTVLIIQPKASLYKNITFYCVTVITRFSFIVKIYVVLCQKAVANSSISLTWK